jgi:diketogulonate reductase-like aldo/keto reductase
MQDHYELQGVTVPSLGFGTYQLAGVIGRQAVREALETGYRHIDTARMYDNEEDVGAGLRESSIPREDIFLTTKIWFDDLSPEGVERQLTTSLDKLGCDHVDLVLVHWPNREFSLAKTLEALFEQRERGRTRLVGVSNFTPSLVQEAMQHAPICCNQVEYHPLLDQSELLELAREHGMVLTAYSPLAQGKALENETVKEIAERVGREPAQVVLRWLLQQDAVVAIPRSSKPDHIKSNFEVFDFELTVEDMTTLSDLAQGARQTDPKWAPAWGS